MNKNADQLVGNLQPPMQNAPGTFCYVPNGCAPFYRFALINLSDDRVEVRTSNPKLESCNEQDTEVSTYIENVVQTYAIQVPYTETIDGQTVTKFRTEHRTRRVPIKKKVKIPAGPDEKFTEQTYTASVPYTEFVDGVSFTRTRLETRTRLVSENEVPQELVPTEETKSYECSNVTLFDAKGSPLDTKEFLESVDAFVPAIQIADPSHIVPYFAELLSADAVFLLVS